MNSRTTHRFRELLNSLPSHVLRQARDAYELFQDDASHPGLHFKKVHSDPPVYSARVGIGYRAGGVLQGDTVIWFWIGSHADYDKLLEHLYSLTRHHLIFVQVTRVHRVVPELDAVVLLEPLLDVRHAGLIILRRDVQQLAVR